jgi:hypothetical protein
MPLRSSPHPLPPVGALANGVDRAARRVWETLKFAALASFAADGIPDATTDTETGTAFVVVAGFAGETFIITITAAVGGDACWLCSTVLRRADVPLLAAFAVAAGVDRTALATADGGSFTVIAAALALDADLIWVAAAIVRWPRLFMLADCPIARFAADWMLQIRAPEEGDLDKAIRTALVATPLAARALDAAWLLRRTSTAAVAAGRDSISTG